MKVLIVVDCQNDFVTGALGTPEAQNVIPIMEDRIKEYADGDTLVLFTKDTHDESYPETLEGQFLPISHCKVYTPGWSLVKSVSSIVDGYGYLTYSSEDVIRGRVLKGTFGSVKLVELLKKNQELISEIIFMGFCTDICVISNVLMTKSFLPNTPITVIASCCAGSTPDAHYAALKVMENCHISVKE